MSWNNLRRCKHFWQVRNSGWLKFVIQYNQILSGWGTPDQQLHRKRKINIYFYALLQYLLHNKKKIYIYKLTKNWGRGNHIILSIFVLHLRSWMGNGGKKNNNLRVRRQVTDRPLRGWADNNRSIKNFQTPILMWLQAKIMMDCMMDIHVCS